ncbi:MAG: DUF1588 domain-containing protein [Deltaproteobacteria bacterium]|nr:DUF1588 domain-containing protein [Deltaproteobacteria bacterium]
MTLCIRCAALPLVLLVAGACSGSIGGGGSNAGSEDPGGGNGGNAASVDEPTEAPEASSLCAVMPQRLWRLTPMQLERTYAALLGGDAVTPGLGKELSGFVPKGASFYSNNEPILSVSPAFYEQLYNAVGTMVEPLSKTPTKLAGCFADGVGEPCVKATVADLGLRALRRPLSDAEVQTYADFFTGLTGKTDKTTALARTLQRLLMHPEVLFRSEVGVKADKLYALTDLEVATAVSYTLSGAPAQGALWEDAKTKRLNNKAVTQHAQRLLADPALVPEFFTFLFDYLKVELSSADAKAALKDFIVETVWKDAGDFKTLMTAPYTFAAGKKTTTTEPRAGILTTNAVLTVERNRSARGKFIREHFFCEDPVSVPLDVNTDINARRAELEQAAGRTLTDEELRTRHVSDPTCAPCHSLIDPIAQPLHVFDDMGRYRTSTASGAIVTKGKITGTLMTDGDIADAPDLAAKLANSGEVRRCFVQQTLQFVRGRPATPEEECVVDVFVNKFEKSGGNIRQLLIDIIGSDNFRFRSVNAL